MMLSRVAENLYWLGRYAERAESTARVVNVNANLLLDLPRGIAPGWEPLIAITGSQAEFDARNTTADERNVVSFLVSDRESQSSIVSTLHAARENARTIRDNLPREAWESLNEVYHYARDNASAGISKRGRHNYLLAVIRGVQQLAGVLLGTMNHDQGYTFLTVGRILERADMTTRIIDVRSESLLPDPTLELRPFEAIQWMSVLKSLSAYQMYRQKQHPRIARTSVLQFLLQDAHFPRAIMRCTTLIEDGLVDLPRNDDSMRTLMTLRRAVARAEPGTLAHDTQELHGFIDDLQLRLAEVHDAIATTYFLPRPEA